ncbi:MAG: glycosyltransferase family 2 protein [FCB group bacterium]|nr:glycosyltransferase family 2 protein [FCB group bacterium]
MNYIIAIPAYNAEKTLPQLIKAIRDVVQVPILIIDDGSEVPVNTLNLPNDIILRRNSLNRGKGYCLRSAFAVTRELKFTHVITLDADLQHDPAEIRKFTEPAEDIDIVYGRRSLGGKMPLHRRLSNFMTSLIVSLIAGVKVLDSQCGYRRYRLERLNELTFVENGFQFETEVLLRVLRAGGTVSPVPVSTLYRNEKSSIRNVRDTVKFIKLIIRSLFW